MVSLIEHLNRGGTFSYFWLKEPDGSSRTIWYPVGKFPDIPPDATNVYFGVNPCKAIPQRGKPEKVRATLDDLSSINCLFAEFDAKDYNGKQPALSHINNLSLSPNVVVDSGGGYHCYWLLTNPMKIVDHATLTYFQNIQARWVAHVGGDKGAKDLARVLRVPGTYNYKYDPPAEVWIVNEDNLFYELHDLMAILPAEEEHHSPAPSQSPVTPGQPNPDRWLQQALSRAGIGNRNETGFWLAAQMRDDGISEGDARSTMLRYQQSVAGSNGNSYTEREAMQSLRSAYRSARREPARNTARTVTPPVTNMAAQSQPVIDQAVNNLVESHGPTPPDTELRDPNTENGDGDQNADHTTENGDTVGNGNYLPFARVKDALDNQEHGDAELMAEFYRGRLVYDHSEGAWYLWRKHFWERDKTGMVYRLIARRVAPQYLYAAAEAQRSGNEDTAKKLAARAASLRNKKRMDNVLFLAARQHGIALTGDEWDADPWVLGCGNGVIDLRSGQLRNGKPEDYIRAHSEVEYNPHATSQVWQKFLSDVFGGDADLVSFVRRLLGYSITGLTREHVFPILWGEGRNGKSTLLETLADVLGNDIATSSQADALMDASKGGDGPKPFIWSLRGKRLVWASESNEGRRINEGLVKQLTGGDRLNVRTLHSKPVEFMPTHTLLLLTNHKPHINADGSAIWDRVYLVPFTQRFIDQPKEPNEHQRDPDLRDKLRGELSGVLTWLVRGCLEYQKIGLLPVASITAATAEYREEEDTTSMFITERCVSREGISVRSSKLYQSYTVWCKESGLQPMSITAFSKWVKRRYKTRRDKIGVLFDGIGLAVEENAMPF